MSKRKQLPVFEKVEISDVAAEGKAVTRQDGRVIFVNHHCVPGDVVDIQVVRKRKKFFEAIPLHFHAYSEKRTDAFCEHFGTCGGCKWQHLKYKEQLRFKQQQVVDQLSRIGHLDLPEVNPILPSPQTRYYRNKLEYTFSHKRWLTKAEIERGDIVKDPLALGFHVPGRFDKVMDVKNCYLQPDPSNDIRLAVKDYALKHDLSFFDLKKQEGFLRNLIIRTSNIGEVMVILSFFYEDEEKREGLLNHLHERFPEIDSLMYVINSKANDSIYDLSIESYQGKDHIIEEMEGLRFKIGPKSFFQTNSEQAYNLYAKVRQMANLYGHETVYDLYTGIGTIANFIAKNAKSVIGVESVSEAVDNARENTRLNDHNNVSFFAGDMKDTLSIEFMEKNSKPDVIIMDPPRAGVHPKVLRNITFALPGKIIYVSCNPSTQARDIEQISKYYDIRNVQPVDMFPHTHHVENIVLLTKKF